MRRWPCGWRHSPPTCGGAAMGRSLLRVGCAITVVALGVRWVEVKHAPLQNLFEVFMVLGALMFPLWLFCRSILGAGGRSSKRADRNNIALPGRLRLPRRAATSSPRLAELAFRPARGDLHGGVYDPDNGGLSGDGRAGERFGFSESALITWWSSAIRC